MGKIDKIENREKYRNIKCVFMEEDVNQRKWDMKTKRKKMGVK